jgi:hypothetical protein
MLRLILQFHRKSHVKKPTEKDKAILPVWDEILAKAGFYTVVLK